MPQGSSLGPLFFIIYINDLPGVISGDSSFALYANDSKLDRVINSPEDVTSFQGDLDKKKRVLWLGTITLRIKVLKVYVYIRT